MRLIWQASFLKRSFQSPCLWTSAETKLLMITRVPISSVYLLCKTHARIFFTKLPKCSKIGQISQIRYAINSTRSWAEILHPCRKNMLLCQSKLWRASSLRIWTYCIFGMGPIPFRSTVAPEESMHGSTDMECFILFVSNTERRLTQTAISLRRVTTWRRHWEKKFLFDRENTLPKVAWWAFC